MPTEKLHGHWVPDENGGHRWRFRDRGDRLVGHMPDDQDGRFLRCVLFCIALIAGIWSAGMLVGGIRAAGQLESEWNPLGAGIAYVAALAIVSSTAVFYYVLACRKRVSLSLLILTGSLVAGMTVFATVTQTVMVVDASSGQNFVQGQETMVRQTAQNAERIDQAVTQGFQSKVDFHAQRMAEEEPSGKGPLYRAAQRAYNGLRAEYGATLATPINAAPLGRSLSADAQAVAAFVERLEAKVAVYERFASAEGLQVPDYRAQTKALQARIAGAAESDWIDRKALVYREVMRKLAEMIASFGMADLGFTLNVLLALSPDLIQVLCACLLLFLRPSNDPDQPETAPAAAWRDGEPCWEPGDAAWGDVPSSDNVH